jgi:hypothetical protein
VLDGIDHRVINQMAVVIGFWALLAPLAVDDREEKFGYHR